VAGDENPKSSLPEITCEAVVYEAACVLTSLTYESGKSRKAEWMPFLMKLRLLTGQKQLQTPVEQITTKIYVFKHQHHVFAKNTTK